MPGFDRKGPAGEGPRTGRGLGKCGPAPGSDKDDQPAAEEKLDDRRGMGMAWRRGGGRGMGRGFGRGRGRRGGVG